jgi:hypothetical protein
MTRHSGPITLSEVELAAVVGGERCMQVAPNEWLASSSRTDGVRDWHGSSTTGKPYTTRAECRAANSAPDQPLAFFK